MNLQVPPPNSPPAGFGELTPVTVITGFLGSGKTTIIKNLLQSLNQAGAQVVYIKNEAGDMDIDTKQVKGVGVVSQELLNGCVCCTLVGPLLETIDSLIDQYHPDRIIIESSGAAEPVNLALTLGGGKRIYRDGLLCVVDTLNYNLFPEYNDHYQIQAKLTDLLILNKLELVDDRRKQDVIDQLRLINSYSPIVEAEAGSIPLELAFGSSREDLEKLLSNKQIHEHSHWDGLILQTSKRLERAGLEAFCGNLPSNVIRLKGWAYCDQAYILNQVYKRLEIFSYDLEPKPTDTKLYLVGEDLKSHQDQIESEFKQLTD